LSHFTPRRTQIPASRAVQQAAAPGFFDPLQEITLSQVTA
jgi:hypothetical protein